MSALYLLIPIGLLFLVIAIRAFFWAINSGQYDDLKTEGERILFDDKQKIATPKTELPNPHTTKNKTD